LWSTSWVLIKFGLHDIPALTFAGLRYALATLCLLPLALRSGQLVALRKASAGTWLRLVVLGLLYYALTQGAQFLSLAYLPAVTVSLMLSCTTILVAWLSVPLLRERPTVMQWVGIGLYGIGVGVYFYPFSVLQGSPVGYIVSGIGVLANALSSILGRHVNRRRELGPLAVTTVSMGIGAVALLVTGVSMQGLPRLTGSSWVIVAWLAVVNGALAFTLWNRALRVLSATESSILNNTMLFQIALLAWVFLGEPLTGRQIVGMVVAGLGTLAVQVRRSA
jgi:drug/metabolite transporter (DMT)-like permease